MKVAQNTKKTVPSLDIQSICDISERAFWDGLEILAVIQLLEIGNMARPVTTPATMIAKRLAQSLSAGCKVAHL